MNNLCAWHPLDVSIVVVRWSPRVLFLAPLEKRLGARSLGIAILYLYIIVVVCVFAGAT